MSMSQKVTYCAALSLGVLAASSVAAHAAIAGGLDIQSGLSSLYAYGRPTVATAMCIGGLAKGTHSFVNHREIGSAAAGMIGGGVLAFGAPTIMTVLGM